MSCNHLKFASPVKPLLQPSFIPAAIEEKKREREKEPC
jgi:hypothetical protein